MDAYRGYDKNTSPVNLCKGLAQSLIRVFIYLLICEFFGPLRMVPTMSETLSVQYMLRSPHYHQSTMTLTFVRGYCLRSPYIRIWGIPTDRGRVGEVVGTGPNASFSWLIDKLRSYTNPVLTCVYSNDRMGVSQTTSPTNDDIP